MFYLILDDTVVGLKRPNHLFTAVTCLFPNSTVNPLLSKEFLTVFSTLSSTVSVVHGSLTCTRSPTFKFTPRSLRLLILTRPSTFTAGVLTSRNLSTTSQYTLYSLSLPDSTYPVFPETTEPSGL